MIGELFLSTYIFAGQINHTVSVNPSDLTFTKFKGYDLVKLKGCKFSTEIGAPMLPQLALQVLIPPSANVTNVEVRNTKAEILSGEYKIYPTQLPQPMLFEKQTEWVEPNSDIYSQTSPFPETLARCSHTGNMGGYRIAGILVYPVQYLPAQKKLILNSEIEIQITYKEEMADKPQKTLKEKTLFGKIIKKMVINPNMVKHWSPDISSGSRSKVLSPDTIEYVIITSSSFASGFQPLADWKTKKGVPARIVPLDTIYANYSGADNAERVRNFVKDANSTWGTMWFLLGGQCDYENGQEVVPRRDVYYITSGVGAYPDEDSIPSDLYFSDLDGTWNADGDGTWGESTDGVDLYSDVFVGRAPARTTTHVQKFVNKTLTYEKNPPAGYLKRMLLPSAKLTSSYYGEAANDEIAAITPTGWSDIELSERYGTLSKTGVVNNINSGIGFCHFSAHGDPYGVEFYGGGYFLSSSDVSSLTNGNKLGIFNAMSCFTGGLDEVSSGDCFAEYFLNSSNGGGVASIMNSRFGWGNPPQLGPSELIDISLYDEIFNNGVHNLGTAHAISKNTYVPQVTWSYCWAWCIYELNLFGDPELPVWTDEPGNLVVAHPDTIGEGETSFQVTVTNSKAPVNNALVCVLKEGEVYERGLTNSSGVVTLTLSPPPSLGILFVTVTKPNYRPYEGETFVKTVGVEDRAETPKVFAIHQNSPNPFSKVTTINYQLPCESSVELSIYDISGNFVRTLVNESQKAGYYQTNWDACDNGGKEVFSGIYFYQIKSEDITLTRKAILFRQ